MQLKHPETIIFITGGPGTGKSYAARQLMKHFPSIQLVSYDHIKEKEWDHFGFDNAQQKDRLNWFCLEEFYLTLQKLMWEKKTIITEYPFYQRHRDQLASLVDYSGYHAITLLLTADLRTVYERGRNRDNNDNRHPGHLTNTYHIEQGLSPENIIPDAVLTYEEFYENISKKNYDIQLGTTIKVDVTDFSKVDFQKIIQQILKIDQTSY